MVFFTLNWKQSKSTPFIKQGENRRNSENNFLLLQFLQFFLLISFDKPLISLSMISQKGPEMMTA